MCFIDPIKQETRATLSVFSGPWSTVCFVWGFYDRLRTKPALIVTGSCAASIYLTYGSYAGVLGKRLSCMIWALLPVKGSLLRVFHLKPTLVKAFLTSGSACIFPSSSEMWNSSTRMWVQYIVFHMCSTTYSTAFWSFVISKVLMCLINARYSPTAVWSTFNMATPWVSFELAVVSLMKWRS